MMLKGEPFEITSDALWPIWKRISVRILDGVCSMRQGMLRLTLKAETQYWRENING